MSEAPYRYKAVITPLSFWQSVRLWWQTLEWSTTKIDYVAVKPGEPDYEKAEFDCAIIYQRVGDIELQKHSHFQ